MYWTPQTGAREVLGLISQKWSGLGSQSSFLGYPLTRELSAPDGVGRFNSFRGGSIYWTPQTAAREVHGRIRDEWASLEYERGFLGYPTSDKTKTPDGLGRLSRFQGGCIYWSPSTDAHEVQGAIGARYVRSGVSAGFLGYPLTRELSPPAGVGPLQLLPGRQHLVDARHRCP